MPDYSGCLNKGCIYKYNCSRYMMVVNNPEWQTYCHFEKGKDGICEGWWPVKDAPFKCHTQEEMEEFEATTAQFKRP